MTCRRFRRLARWVEYYQMPLTFLGLGFALAAVPITLALGLFTPHPYL